MISKCDQEKILSMYPDVGYLRIAKTLRLPQREVRSVLVDNGVKIKKEAKDRYKINAQAFDSLDSEEAAYWLGFIYADGCVYTNSLRVDVGAKDSEHLMKFEEYLGTSRPPYNYSGHVLFQVRNTHLANRLKNLGILPDRPNASLSTDRIPHHQRRHFIRGLFDGDGCMVRGRPRATIVGRVDMLQWVNSACGYAENKVYPIKTTKKVSLIQFGGRTGYWDFCEFIYTDASICLERKRETYKMWRKRRL